MTLCRLFLIVATTMAISCSNTKDQDLTHLSIAKNYQNQNLSDFLPKLWEDKVSGFVVISFDAKEYNSLEMARADTSGSKAIVRIDTERFDHHTPPEFEEEKNYHWGSPLVCRKVLQDHGDVIEVRTLDPDEDMEMLGHGGLGADYLFELTTYVRKMDLVPVINRTYSLGFNDGTFVQLNPGVAVGIPWDGNEKKRVLSIHQLHFEFSIPDSLLQLSYSPIIENQKKSRDNRMLNEKATLFLNGKEFCPVDQIRSEKLRTPVSEDRINNEQVVQLKDDGIELRLKINMGLVKSYTPNIDRPILTNRFNDDNRPSWYYQLFEGTPIYWENGRQAGIMRQYLGYYTHQRPGDSMYCDIMPELFEHMQLCFKLSDIEFREVQ